jgi:hypothetical protein
MNSQLSSESFLIMPFAENGYTAYTSFLTNGDNVEPSTPANQHPRRRLVGWINF